MLAPADSAPRVVVSFRNVDIVYGKDLSTALWLIDQGRSRAEILRVTGQLVGVKHATLDVGEGEIVVLMGLSGSGKSTLLRAVNGLTKITRGSVTVFNGETDVEVQSCSARELRQLRRQRIAMVFQQFGLLPWRTVNDNIALGLELGGVSRSQRRETVAEQLELVGLTGWGDKLVHELSGGMQQRVGLARAFATSAPVLLMDEPFSALDPLIRVRLQDELLQLQRRLNRTIIFVSHDLDEALKIGTRVAMMEGGDIVQIGTPQEIVLDPCNEYVSEFVAHMNPLNVLRAQEIMVPLGRLERGPDGAARIEGDFIVTGDGQARRNGQPVPVAPIDELDAAPAGCVVSVACRTPVRTLIEAKLQHAGPFIVREGDAIRGIVRDEDLFRCLIRAQPAESPPPPPQPAPERPAAVTLRAVPSAVPSGPPPDSREPRPFAQPSDTAL